LAFLKFEGLRVATGAVDMAAFGAAGSSALVLLLLDAQHYGLLIAQIFFGLWLAPLGYLAYRSGWFSKASGVVLVAASASYLVDLLAAFLFPDLGKAIMSSRPSCRRSRNPRWSSTCSRSGSKPKHCRPGRIH
jgi:uncharacterized protein DUF4386